MAKHTPPAGAAKLTVYGKTVALFVSSIFEGNDSINVVYEDNGSWHFLAQPDYYTGNIKTKADTDEYFNTALETINTAIKDKLQPKDKGDEPDNGSARIEWLLGQLVVVNNKLSTK